MQNFQTQLLINGKFVKGEGALISVLNPATEVEITQVAEASLAQIQQAVSAAASAFSSWKKPRRAIAQPCCLNLQTPLNLTQKVLLNLNR